MNQTINEFKSIFKEVQSNPTHFITTEGLIPNMSRYATDSKRQTCRDILSCTPISEKDPLYRDLELGMRLATLGYSLPEFVIAFSRFIHQPNVTFRQTIDHVIAANGSKAQQNLMNILEGKCNQIILPKDSQFSGFYIRTPVQVWNPKGKATTKIPTFEKRYDLSESFISGNVNFYVVKRPLPEGIFDIYVMFRGTSNEFNAIPQYGKDYENTQVYRVPQYDPLTDTFILGGSVDKPLLFYVYCDMIRNIENELFSLLQGMGAMESNCRRIVVAGHSMGGALVNTLCYISYYEREEYWKKMVFRAYASPMHMNSQASSFISQAIINSAMTNKYTDTINSDDIIISQYQFGGKTKIKDSISSGLNSFTSQYISGKSLKNITDVESTFIKGVMSTQLNTLEIVPPTDLTNVTDEEKKLTEMIVKSAARVGMDRFSERDIQACKMNHVYERRLRVILCERLPDENGDYDIYSHEAYLNMYTTNVYKFTRTFEDNLYRLYHEKGLKHTSNRMIVLPMAKAEQIDDYLSLATKIKNKRIKHKSSITKENRKIWNDSKDLYKHI